MKHLIIIITLLINTISSENVHICTNGLFKCVSSNSLRICLNGQLISSEVFCPNNTHCSEASPTICMTLTSNSKVETYSSQCNCTESGTFPLENTNCQKYFQCFEMGNSFRVIRLKCYNGYFDPFIKACTTNYTCPETSPDIPKCTKEGTIPYPNTKCQNYILCRKTPNGLESLVKYCTSGYFNPESGECDQNYICPELDVPTSSTESITTNSTTFEPTITNVINTEPTESTTSNINGTTPSLQQCKQQGKFVVPNTGCTKFKWCILTTHGMEEYMQQCPNGSLFDPNLQQCSEGYICQNVTSTPESESTTHIPVSPTSSTIITSKIPVITTTTIITTTQRSSSTTQPNTNNGSTIPECIKPGIHPVPQTSCAKFMVCQMTSHGLTQQIKNCPNGTLFDPFNMVCTNDYICIENGAPSKEPLVFKNPECILGETNSLESTNCTKYVKCSLTSNGIVQEVLNCPDNNVFDPFSKECTKNYVCPDSDVNNRKNTVNTTEISIESTENFEQDCTKRGKFPILNSYCTKYMNCLVTTHGFSKMVLDCNPGTYFDPFVQSCTETYFCLESITPVNTISTSTIGTTLSISSTSSISTTSNTDSTGCNQQGLFAIPNTGCKKFRRCILTTNGFVLIFNECLLGSLFDPTLQQCSKLYVCTETTTPSTSEFSTTTKVESTTPAIDEVSKLCTTVGKIPVSGANCTKYILCAKTGTGFVGKIYECPNGFFFDPIRKRCNSLYQCTENAQTTTQIIDTTSTTASSTTTEVQATTPTIDDVSKLCTTVGKIPILGANCTKYILCAKTSTGFVGKVYECPNGFFFDPIRKRCNSLYQCTENAQTTTQIVDTTTTASSTTTEVQATTPTIDDVSKLCTTVGKIPVLGANCTKYILCAKTSTGFVGKVYECPNGFFFDPIRKRCNSLYQCTENAQTTTQIIDTTSTTASSTTTEVQATTPTIDDVSKLCTTVGKIPVLGANCTKYILCAKTSTGFVGKIYECPNGFFFDPIRKRCNSLYQCKENVETTTQIIDTTSTTAFVTTEIQATTQKIDETTTPSTTTKVETTTSAIDDVSKLCTTVGKIPVLGANCTKYILCAKTGTGFVGKIYKCPNGFFFDPIRKRCNSLYQCKENVQTTTEIIDVTSTTEFRTTSEVQATTPKIDKTTTQSTTEFITTTKVETTTPAIDNVSKLCTTVGKIPVLGTNCTKYILCAKTSTGFIGKIYNCPNGFFFDPIRKRCNSLYQCKENAQTTTQIADTSTTESITTTEVQATTPTIDDVSKLCTTVGKIPVLGANCTKYILCAKISTGFIGKIYECPNGFFFDPIRKRCNSLYQCKENVQTTTQIIDVTSTTEFRTTTEVQATTPKIDKTTTQSTTVFITTTKVETTTPEIEDVSKLCTIVGKIPVLGANCTKYILCAKTSTGFIGKIYECPNGCFFDPIRKRCSSLYHCKENVQTTTQIIDTTITTEFVTTTEIMPIPETPKCITEGRFSVPGTKCKQYILCVDTKNGFVSAGYSCPENSLFNPARMRCSKNYTCDDDLIRCSTIGNFPDDNDSTCKNYYNCVVRGDYVQAIRKQCNQYQFFDPEIQRCTYTYTCKNKSTRKALQNNVASSRILVNGQCTTVGRYVVQLSNCKQYVYCSVNTDGTLKGTNFTCPTTTVFNQVIQKCANPSSYTCPDSFCANNPGLISSANPNIKGCTTYITCQPIYNTTTGLILGYSGIVNYCPSGQRFNPMLQICDPMYVCPSING